MFPLYCQESSRTGVVFRFKRLEIVALQVEGTQDSISDVLICGFYG